MSKDPTALWRNVPGFLYLNSDVVEEVRQLSGSGGKGTVDELGFQVLYDRIAQKLFPWCSTLTTRARYFFFSAAVLDLALKEVIDDTIVDPNRDTGDSAALYDRKRRALMGAIRRIERALALSLCARHELSERGIFGSIRCRRWLRDNTEVIAREKILSSDARYPNAIYRGSCRSLRMFSVNDSSMTGLVRARMAGQSVLAADWQVHSRFVTATIGELDAYWSDAVRDRMSFAVAQANLQRVAAFRSFEGFELRREEAKFLYGQIQESTGYFAGVSADDLPKLFKNGDLELEVLKRATSATTDPELFDAARHIDLATKPFRGLYLTFASGGQLAIEDRININALRQSKNWLDGQSINSAMDWAPVWRDEMSHLIGTWIDLVSRDRTCALLREALFARAEEVVSSRGLGKLAPHQRRADPDDIRDELEVRETSFRIGNGSMILRDIERALSR